MKTENKVIEFSLRKTNILIRCPHCKKEHYLGIGVFDKIHRGGKQKEKLIEG